MIADTFDVRPHDILGERDEVTDSPPVPALRKLDEAYEWRALATVLLKVSSC